MRKLPVPRRTLATCAVAALLATGCQSSTSDTPPDDGGVSADPDLYLPFEAASASTYVVKVKALLTGLPASDSEVAAVEKDPAALAGLIDQWMALPQYQTKMMAFFQQAFQQTQTTIADYEEQLGMPVNPWTRVDAALFTRAAEEMFARTVWALIQEGRPFTEAVTTQRFQMNTPLMAALTFTDTVAIADEYTRGTSYLLAQYPNFTFTRVSTGMPIPIEQSIDPLSPNFMHWFDPMPYRGPNMNCAQEPHVDRGIAGLIGLGDFLFGGRPGCGTTVSQFQASEYDSWRWVTVRAPKQGEKRTLFWDLPSLRKANELVLATPRAGFLSTPAFFANWPTNLSNLARVTVNQSLIVGLGRSFDDRDVTVPVSESTNPDEMHVQPGTACYGCHKTLDPMRDFYRATYTVNYHQQMNPAETAKKGVFALDDVSVAGQGVVDYAKAMASHPAFPGAWVQKLCRYANSSSCLPDDPEFLRVADVFTKSNFSWKVVVREIFSSPLVTGRLETKTSMQLGTTISIARREHLCAALEARFGIVDACGLAPQVQRGPSSMARNIVTSIPGSGYARGAEVPLMPHDPNLFFMSATENLCGLMADKLVDGTAPSRYSSAKADEAMADFVATVMALPARDPRSAPALDLLKEHFAAAKAAGETAKDALKSTFVLACSSPLGVSSGL